MEGGIFLSKPGPVDRVKVVLQGLPSMIARETGLFSVEGSPMEKDDRDSIVFRTKLNNVKDAINMLLDKGIIDTNTYVSFLVRILEVKAMEELDELVSEVAQVCKERGK